MFDITINPVDDSLPIVQSFGMTVQEGVRKTITEFELKATDADTEVRQDPPRPPPSPLLLHIWAVGKMGLCLKTYGLDTEFMASTDENGISSSSWVWPEAELSNIGSASLLLPCSKRSGCLSQNPAPKVFAASALAEVARDTLPGMAAGLRAALVFTELSQGWELPQTS